MCDSAGPGLGAGATRDQGGRIAGLLSAFCRSAALVATAASSRLRGHNG